MKTELALSGDTPESRDHFCCICGMELLPIEEGLSGDAGQTGKKVYCLKCWFLAWRGYPKLVHHSREHFGYADTPGRDPTVLSQIDAKAIAVLPFQNGSTDPEHSYFCDGLTEDIISQLSKIGDLRVIAWSSVSDYRGSDKALQEISEELGVPMVLSGKVSRSDSHMELVTTLFDYSKGEAISEETYQGTITDYFVIQGKVVKEVASSLNAELMPEEVRRIERIPTESVAAYEFYMRGRRELDQGDKKDNEKAIGYLNKALELDPDFALAYAGLGEAYVQRVHRHGSAATWLDSSIEMAEKAITLDPDLAEAHSTMSLVYYLKGWFSQALLEDRKAVAINPNLPGAVYGLGYDYLVLGDLAETLRWLTKAVLLDPRDAENHQQIGWIFLTLGKQDEAEWWLTRSLELQPGYEEAQHRLGYLKLQQGDVEAALQQAKNILSDSKESLSGLDLAAAVEINRGRLESAGGFCQKILEISSTGPTHLTKVAAYRLAYILWVKERRPEAQRLFDIQINQHQEAMKKGDQSWVPRFFLASIYAVKGKQDLACTWLKKAIEAGFRDSGYFDLFDDWNRLKADEEFKEIMGQFRGDLEKMRRRAEAMREQQLPGLRVKARVEPQQSTVDAESEDPGKE